ncbi:hypothetical protein OHB35_28665 [Streptomyces phaeochromogenes]|uniref:Uncharacterized protein n=1 Tax=Streptomyces phaeochromogenes TaxID=1923 RepID=A0ABZ1HHZ6_STRPH|nr:hypothetical protein [Streptomyces phaeochromogenes]WSD16900.1 hypothetical protein OHB35_28665 [Streptomyces phaeochromogenes]
MAHRDPPGIIAPHIPADAYRRAEATGQPVVIVVHTTDQAGRPLRHYLLPLAIAGAAAVGGWGLVAALCALLDAAAHTVTVIAQTAGPIGIGGITLRLARPKG